VLAPGWCACHSEIIVILNTVCGIQTSLVRERIVLILALCVVVTLGASTAGCGEEESDAASGAKVVAAFYPLAFLAERIDTAADVTNVTPAGAEPHDVELSARDIERVHDADVVLYLGRGFQPALEDAVSGQDGAVDLLQGMVLTGDEADADPHVWLDPMRFGAMARRVAVALGQPSAADALVADLERLDLEFRTGLAHCERRELVTSHAAFGYLAHAYGLTQVPLTGVVPEAEPSARDLEALVREVEDTGATTVFFEPLVSSKLADTVAREADVTTEELDPLEGLTEDEVAAGEDYFSVMRANLAALRKALGCT
jgi:zinc transport system substrate-binding protein